MTSKIEPVRILVVDDSARWRTITRRLLEDYPDLQIVGEAVDGLEAVRKAAELKPDLILLDIGLPHLDGMQAAKQINELVPHAKIIFVTQEHHLGMAQRALSNGVKGYVVKTRATTELKSAIDRVLEGKPFISVGLIE